MISALDNWRNDGYYYLEVEETYDHGLGSPHILGQTLKLCAQKLVHGLHSYQLVIIQLGWHSLFHPAQSVSWFQYCRERDGQYTCEDHNLPQLVERISAWPPKSSPVISPDCGASQAIQEICQTHQSSCFSHV